VIYHFNILLVNCQNDRVKPDRKMWNWQGGKIQIKQHWLYYFVIRQLYNWSDKNSWLNCISGYIRIYLYVFGLVSDERWKL